jgi:hypothetical protein
MFLAVRSAKDDTEAPADADVRLGVQHFGVLGAEPARYFCRVRPGSLDFRRQRVQAALESKTGLGGHTCSLNKDCAARELFGATWRCGLPVRGLPEGVAGHDRALNMPKSDRSKVLFRGSLPWRPATPPPGLI